MLKYLGAVLGCLTCLPLFVAPFVLVAKSGITDKTSSETYGLFADLSGLADGYKMYDKTFQSFWVTLFQIAVIVALVVAVVMLVVYILNDLGVLKLQKLEKVLATVLLVVGVVALVDIILCSLLNVATGEITKTTISFVGSFVGWLVPAFAILGGIFGIAGAGQKTKKKRK